MSGPPKSAPSRVALPPIGVSMRNAARQASPYSATPMRRVVCSRGTTARNTAQNAITGQNAAKTNGSVPPSGNATDIASAGARPAAAIQAPVRHAGVTRLASA